jgi:hypothetical protein
MFYGQPQPPPLLLSDLTTKELEEEYFLSKYRKIDYALRSGTSCFAALVELTVDDIDAMTIGGFRAYYKEFPVRKATTASVASVSSSVRPSCTDLWSAQQGGHHPPTGRVVPPSTEQIAAQRAAKKAAKLAKRLPLRSTEGASVSADRSADPQIADVSASGTVPGLSPGSASGAVPEALPSVTEGSAELAEEAPADLQITVLPPVEDLSVATERVDVSVIAEAVAESSALQEVLQEVLQELPSATAEQRTLSPEEWPSLPSPSPLRSPVRLSLQTQKQPQKQSSPKQSPKRSSQKQKRRAPKAKPHPFPLSLPPLQLPFASVVLQITLRSVF